MMFTKKSLGPVPDQVPDTRSTNVQMHLTWMDTTMHGMGSLGHTLQIDLPRVWANLAVYRDMWVGVVSRC